MKSKLKIGRKLCGAVALLLALPGIASVVTDSPEEQAKGHLPAGAALARVRQWGSPAPAKSEAVVTTGSFVKLGSKDLVFVYENRGGLMLRMVAGGPGRAQELDAPLPGTFVSSVKSVPNGILSKDIAGQGVELLFVVTSDGASLGNYLGVFSLNEGHVTSVVRGLPIGGDEFNLDCEKGSNCRIVIYGKWTDRSTSRVWVYEWLGSAFLETDKDLDHYFSARLAEIRESASAATPLPATSRVHMAVLAVSLYQDRREYDSAISLCEFVLERLADPTQSVVSSPPSPSSDPSVKLEFDIRQGLAVTHELLARTYDLMGRRSDSEIQHRLAQAIRNGHVNR